MVEGHRMTAADLVDKLLASEHADVLRDSVAWLVAELMEAEVGGLTGGGLGERAPDRRQAQPSAVLDVIRTAANAVQGSTAAASSSAIP